MPLVTRPIPPQQDRWHELLTTRYVCEACFTRFFVPYDRCPACCRVGRIRPLASLFSTIARDQDELHQLIAGSEQHMHDDHVSI
jgi:hypothetical protein